MKNQRQGADSPASASISPSTECLSPAQARLPCLPSDVSLPGAQSAPATHCHGCVASAANRINALEEVLQAIVMEYDVYVAGTEPTHEEDEWVKRARALLSDPYAGADNPAPINAARRFLTEAAICFRSFPGGCDGHAMSLLERADAVLAKLGPA